MRSNTRHFQAMQVAILLLLGLAGAGATRAATISGTVKSNTGTPLSNVDIDFLDLCTGDNIFLSGDKTALDGTYSIVVPNATYDIHYTPPTGSTYAAGERRSYVVSVNANLGITTLSPGRMVSGSVKTPSLGAAVGVTPKFVNTATGKRVHITKDVTNSLGQYAVRVLAGTYDIDFRPPSSTTYADKERLGLTVATSDISGLVDTLSAGFSVTGRVMDTHGAALQNVDLGAFDECTGQSIPTAHDNTDANGYYSIYVPAGTYTFEIDPPRCRAVEAARAPGTVIAAGKDLGTTLLRDAVLVSGIVHDAAGAALADAKIRFYNAAIAGTPRQAAADDRSDSTGAFSIYTPIGTYNIDIDPPAGKILRVTTLSGIAVNGATNIGTVTLASGIAVSGHVVGPGNVPARYVDVNAVDSATRTSVHLANDDTDAAGNLTVVVPPGTYDFQYSPTNCSGYAPASQKSVTVTTTLALPTLTLVPGIHVRGRVLDSGASVVTGVDLDFFPAGTTDKSFTPNDATIADGTYDVVVAPASYDIKYIPPSPSRLRPAVRPNTSLLVTQTLPDLTLANGWLVSGLVKDGSTLLALDSVIVDFYPPGGQPPLWTEHHTTAPDGSYSVAVDAGTWDILYTPPTGSNYAPLWRYGVAVSSDVGLPDALLQPPVTGLEEPAGPRLAILSAMPNPVTGPLTLSLVALTGDAELTAWDISGRRVATLWRGHAASAVTVRWDGIGDSGTRVSSGLYHLRLRDGAGTTIARRILLLR